MTLAVALICQPKVTEQVKHCVVSFVLSVDLSNNFQTPSSVKFANTYPSIMYVFDLPYYLLQRQCRSYPTQNEPRIVHDVLYACSQFPRLSPIVEEFSALPDRNRRLVALRGGISVTTSSFTYVLPLTIWIMPYYPNGPPLFFVQPTPSSVQIHSSHPYVDAKTAMVYSSYLSHWKPQSNLYEALKQTLYNFAASEIPLSSFAQLPLAPSALPSEQRHALILQLSRRAAATLASTHTQAQRSVQILTQQQRKLNSMRSLVLTRKHLHDRLDQLRQWHQFHPVPPEHATIDEITKPRHITQHQQITNIARDHAISDTLDKMDDALSLSHISLEAYVLRVRRLAREQFFNRALAAKLSRSSSAQPNS